MTLPFGVGDFLIVLSEKAFFLMFGLSKSHSSIVVGQKELRSLGEGWLLFSTIDECTKKKFIGCNSMGSP
jgi:hypothetical protein